MRVTAPFVHDTCQHLASAKLLTSSSPSFVLCLEPHCSPMFAHWQFLARPFSLGALVLTNQDGAALHFAPVLAQEGKPFLLEAVRRAEQRLIDKPEDKASTALHSHHVFTDLLQHAMLHTLATWLIPSASQ